MRVNVIRIISIMERERPENGPNGDRGGNFEKQKRRKPPDEVVRFREDLIFERDLRDKRRGAGPRPRGIKDRLEFDEAVSILFPVRNV
jgi:hypothetical protein